MAKSVGVSTSASATVMRSGVGPMRWMCAEGKYSLNASMLGFGKSTECVEMLRRRCGLRLDSHVVLPVALSFPGFEELIGVGCRKSRRLLRILVNDGKTACFLTFCSC